MIARDMLMKAGRRLGSLKGCDGEDRVLGVQLAKAGARDRMQNSC